MTKIPNHVMMDFEKISKKIEKMNTFKYKYAGNLKSNTMKVIPQFNGYVAFFLYGKEECPLCGRGNISTDARFFLNAKDIDRLVKILNMVKHIYRIRSQKK